jgi:hypothetical protein
VSSRNSIGRVVHDSRGNAVWDWDIATVVLARKSTAELLTSLVAPTAFELQLETDSTVATGGFDPYNRSRI